MTETTKIRAATAEDGEFLAWVMQAAARSHLSVGVWDLALPGEDAQRLEVLAALARTEQQHFCHWSRFRVLEVDGRPASALSAYEYCAHGDQALTLGLFELAATLNWSEEKMATVGKSFAPFLVTGYPSPEGVWIIEWVATLPDYRGRRLIHQLLRDVLKVGRAQGFKRAQIGYLLGNIPARSAYKAAGFRWLEDYLHPDFEAAFGTPGLARMQREL